MKISTVSSTFNRDLQTKFGIRSIINQQRPPDEIIIVDDGSTDNTRHDCAILEREAKEKGIDFKYIFLNYPDHRISCYPRNVGFKESTGDIVIFSEPECLHIGNTISQIVEKMDQNPKRTIIASQIWTMGDKAWKNLDQDLFDHPEKIPSHPHAMLITDPNMQNTNAPDSDWGITGSNNCMAGCLIGLERKWFEDVGGFDEEFEGHGGDDFNLYDRLAMYGTGILPCNDIGVIHQWHEKRYPYNIYEMAEKNLTKGTARLKEGEYRANINNNWGAR